MCSLLVQAEDEGEVMLDPVAAVAGSRLGLVGLGVQGRGSRGRSLVRRVWVKVLR